MAPLTHLDPRDRIGESPPMPIYTYRCNACHAEFDQLVRSETKVACPECSATNVVRQLSTFSMIGTAGQTGAFSSGGGGCCGGSCGCAH